LGNLKILSVKTSDFEYELPEEFIAQHPLEPRDSARLLVLDRQNKRIEHSIFRDIGKFLRAGDLLILNETRVIPVRLFAKKIPTGGRVELLLLQRKDDYTWETLVGGKALVAGIRIQVEAGPTAEIIAELGGPRRLVRFDSPIEEYWSAAGHLPLPPYIKTSIDDPERYQTVYAHIPGSAAAPTAGLHFTPDLIEALASKGIDFGYVTLHIGLDTFAPVTEQDPEDHQIHTEWCQVTPKTAEMINICRRSGGRIIAVGTTSVRSLESAARFAAPGESVGPFEGATDLYILPGYVFRAVDGMITNFHLPRSTLLMLVSSFVDRELIMKIYEEAKREKYRFYSFGDAMFIY
jgi:S-adenosylmethionine:tRNA ribosyltransferase-isomerase